MRNWRVAAAVLILVLAIGYEWTRRPRPESFDSPAVLTAVQRLNQLATVKYTLQQVVGIKEDKQPVGSESILLILQATVQAGIDLAGVSDRDITVRPDGAIVVRLPPPKILNVNVDEKATRVWDRQKTWWTPWVPYSLDLEQRARLAGIEAVRKTALDMGILREAERNAELSIRQLLTLAGARSVVIVPASAS